MPHVWCIVAVLVVNAPDLLPANAWRTYQGYTAHRVNVKCFPGVLVTAAHVYLKPFIRQRLGSAARYGPLPIVDLCVGSYPPYLLRRTSPS
jgi:hypothetical protein